jgi:hypothetical protein
LFDDIAIRATGMQVPACRREHGHLLRTARIVAAKGHAKVVQR